MIAIPGHVLVVVDWLDGDKATGRVCAVGRGVPVQAGERVLYEYPEPSSNHPWLGKLDTVPDERLVASVPADWDGDA